MQCVGTEPDVQCGSVHSLRRRPPSAASGVVICVWSVVLRNHLSQLFDERPELPGRALLLPLWLQLPEEERGEKVNVSALLWWCLCYKQLV